jgi:uncharacterized protein (UPF0332 family)
MTKHQAALFENARRALDTARLALNDGDTKAAINRAYYAAFYAATAALLSRGEAPRSHKGVHQRFHFHFVKTGSLEAWVGETLKYAFDLRLRADYEAFTIFDEAAAADLIADVKRFVDIVEAMLHEQDGGHDSSG